MKILIGSLLFATAILIHFPELNSLPQPSSGAGPSHVHEEPPVRQPPVFIELHKRTIRVDIEEINGRNEAVQVRMQDFGPSIPNRNNKKEYNYMTEADYKKVGNNYIQIVTFIAEDANKKRTLLGAKLPNTGQERYYPGDPRALNPDHYKWFITLNGVEYELKYDPRTHTNVDIKLRGRVRNKRPSPAVIRQIWHQLPVTHFGGVYFFLFRGGQANTIQGVALDPFWKFRPGQDYYGLNPLEHPDLHPPLPGTEEQSPEPQQNLHEEHHVEQEQLLEQEHHHEQQHLLQQQYHLGHQNIFHPNSYPYAHQVPDPNQIARHQQNLDQSHQQPQQGAYPQQYYVQNYGWVFPQNPPSGHFPPPGH